MIRLFHFRVPLVRPLVLRHATLHEREGIILELRDTVGRIGFGECSPLPGFFSESISDCIDWLSKNKQKIVQGDCDTAPPSIRSAVAQARFLISCQRDKIAPLQKLQISSSNLPVNALLTGERKLILEKCDRLATDGFTAAKLKVGRGSVTEDLDLVREVRERIPSSISLRLDANQCWSYSDAVEFSNGIDWSKIEYIEEPLAEPRQLKNLKQEVSTIRIALDESYVSHGEGAFSLCPDPIAVILRPQMLGGIDVTRATMRLLSDRGVATVISSAVESSLGMLTVLLCALSGSTPIRPAGLDTLSWLKKDSVVDPLIMKQGRIEWPDWWDRIRINESVGVWREL
jgi:O-succinylbenzoate synthase